MNPRFVALESIRKRHQPLSSANNPSGNNSEIFGLHVFNRSVMQKMLPKDVYKNVIGAMNGQEQIRVEYADMIALAMKEWAMSLGATHYSHWFQPLTGAQAEKHDSFIEWDTPDRVLEKFCGKQLVQGEPDASSFPSGGLRSTYEARGYTGWDPTSPVFIWEGGDGRTLCIPSFFFSWTGDVLDTKIPLLRSDKLLGDAVMRLLKLTGVPAQYVYSTLGCEQEYFVIDRAWYSLRPDLVMSGRTVFGANPPKGQELQDHYFGSVKNRILWYMRDFEINALKLGIPVKTRHNEVAPAQHEAAPVFERSSLAIDHNILLMELMRQTAVKHDLSCLLHEKPFHGVNGSGKHCNWSLCTDTGINLLDPSDTPENNIHFLMLVTAILHAVHQHSTLLRASIASSGNDYRLGGHEAPPSIISVYLGSELENVLGSIEEKGFHARTASKSIYNLGIPVSLDFLRDSTDRNRTSPFAFTGNKFEFRAVGSSANPSLPVTVLNAITTQSLNLMLDEVEQELEHGDRSSKKVIVDSLLKVIRKYLKTSRPIRFTGNNYSEDWVKEAKNRNLPLVKKAIDSFAAFKTDQTHQAFENILTKEELHSRFDIMSENYVLMVNIEINLMLDLFQAHILPAALRYQKNLAESLTLSSAALGSSKTLKGQTELFTVLVKNIEEAIKRSQELKEAQIKISTISDNEEKGKAICHTVLPIGEQLRTAVDALEMIIDDHLWPLPKYREMFFMI